MNMKQNIVPGDLFKAPRAGRTHAYRSGSFELNPTGFSLIEDVNEMKHMCRVLSRVGVVLVSCGTLIDIMKGI